MSGVLDDQTAAYILAVRPHFDTLRDVAAQLAGLLVLAASGATSAAPDHPMLHSAESLFRESSDGIRRLRSTERARAHHRHLTHAADSIETVLSAVRERLGRLAPADLDHDFHHIMAPLNAGYAHLQRAANTLPGFELVRFEHGCCATVSSARPVEFP